MTAMTREELTAFLETEFPQSAQLNLTIEEVGQGGARLRMAVGDQHLRPGGTVSGPTLAWLADVSLYVAILARIGPATQAVTTNLNINFLRRPAPEDLVADCRLLKLGRRLAVGEVAIYNAGDAAPVAHVTGTYSIPPDR